MRHGERKPAVTTPLAARHAVVCVEPATKVVTVRAQQGQTAAGVVDGFVHDDDPPEAHGFDLLIRELLTDEADQFDVRLRELTLIGLDADLFCDPVVVLEEHTLEDSNFCRHATRRPKVRRTEYLLGEVSDPETVTGETLDPVFAGCAVTRDREVDDAIFLAPLLFTFFRHGRFPFFKKFQTLPLSPTWS